MPTMLEDALAAYDETIKHPHPDLATHLANVQVRLEDVNSAMPGTREFLSARGLANVRELDTDGRAALIAHLQTTVALLSREPESPLAS